MLPDFPVGGWKPGVPTSPKFEELTMSRDAGHPQCVTSTRDRDHEAFHYLECRCPEAWQLWKPCTWGGTCSGCIAWATWGSIHQVNKFHLCWCNSQDRLKCCNRTDLPKRLILKGKYPALPHLRLLFTLPVPYPNNITVPLGLAQVIPSLSLKWPNTLTPHHRKLLCFLFWG